MKKTIKNDKTNDLNVTLYVIFLLLSLPVITGVLLLCLKIM